MQPVQLMHLPMLSVHYIPQVNTLSSRYAISLPEWTQSSDGRTCTPYYTVTSWIDRSPSEFSEFWLQHGANGPLLQYNQLQIEYKMSWDRLRTRRSCHHLIMPSYTQLSYCCYLSSTIGHCYSNSHIAISHSNIMSFLTQQITIAT